MITVIYLIDSIKNDFFIIFLDFKTFRFKVSFCILFDIHNKIMSYQKPRPLTEAETALLLKYHITDPADLSDPDEFQKWYDDAQSKINIDEISPMDFCMLEVIFDRRPYPEDL